MGEFICEFARLFAQMAPFLLLGFLIAGIIHVWIPNRLYIPKISASNFKSVLWAAVFGVPLPICSCGVIPASIALKREGASKGASVSFLISTPATGVDSILATYSLLGLPFAILRPIAAFLTALLGGSLTNFAARMETNVYDGNSLSYCQDGKCFCAGEKPENDSFSLRIKEMFRYGFVEMVSNVSRWLCIGIALGALISVFVPDDFFMALRDIPLLCMLCVLLLAMPMYTCATGSIPLALTLIEKGITPGAALVLLMAGPATSLANMLVVLKAFGKRTLFAYLFSIAAGALFFGFIVDVFFMDTFLSAMSYGNSSIPDGLGIIGTHGAISPAHVVSSTILAFLMVYSWVRPSFLRKGGSAHGKPRGADVVLREGDCLMQKKMSKVYLVHGMSCSHCKACIEKSVRSLDGVDFAIADVKNKELLVEGRLDDSMVKKAVEDAGFEFLGEKQ